MEPSVLPEPDPEVGTPERHLEVLPGAGGLDAPDVEEKEEAALVADSTPLHDPLKLYVRALADQGRTIRLPVHVAEQARKMLRSRRILTQKLNRDPTVEEVAKDSGFTPERVRELLELVEDPVSLETPVGDGESLYGDLIEDT